MGERQDSKLSSAPSAQFQPELVGIVAVLKQDVIDQRAVLGLLPEDQGAVDLLALLREILIGKRLCAGAVLEIDVDRQGGERLVFAGERVVCVQLVPPGPGPPRRRKGSAGCGWRGPPSIPPCHR